MTTRGLLLISALAAAVNSEAINGGWSPWTVDAEIDCCMYGGYERVMRYCNNPVPENGGRKCSKNDGSLSMTETRWRSCTCMCKPDCDGTTSFCANDTGRPAHCECNYGSVLPTDYDPNDVISCQDPPPAVTITVAAEPCPVYKSDTWQTIGNLCRWIAAGWISLALILLLCIFAGFGVFRAARLLHMQEEITLLLATILLAVPFEDFLASEEIPCMIIAFLTQFSFLATMVFFLLEAIFAYSMVTYIVPKDGFFSKVINMIIGYATPLIVTGISLGIAFDSMGKSGCHCACDFDTAQAWCTLVPLVVLAFAAGTTAEAAAQERYKELSDTDPGQFKHADVDKTGLLLVMPLALLMHVFGLLALHSSSGPLWIVQLVFALPLGPIIFIYHTQCDEKVGTFMYHKVPFMPFYNRWAPPEQPIESGSTKPTHSDGDSETDSDGGGFEDFWKWVTDGREGDIVQESQDVLFKKSAHRK